MKQKDYDYDNEMSCFLIYLISYEDAYDKNNELDVFGNIMSRALMEMPPEEHDEAINESTPESLLIRIRDYIGEIVDEEYKGKEAKTFNSKNDLYFRNMFLARFMFEYSIITEMEIINEKKDRKNQ